MCTMSDPPHPHSYDELHHREPVRSDEGEASWKGGEAPDKFLLSIIPNGGSGAVMVAVNNPEVSLSYNNAVLHMCT